LLALLVLSAGGATGAAPTDPQAGNQQPLNIMRVPQALDILGRQPAGVKVMVQDTGLDLQHPDLRGRLFTFRSPTPAPSAGGGGTIPRGGHGWDIIGQTNGCAPDGEDPDANPDDPVGCSGHGTAVAGVLGAAWNNGKFAAGVAPNARFVAMRSCWDGDQCYDHIQPAVAEWAGDHGVRVVTFSWLSGPNPPMTAAMRRSPRTLFVGIPSGNGGAFNADPTNPFPCTANIPNIICVTTSAPNGGLDCGAFGRTSVDVAVPTRNMTTTRNGGGSFRTGCATSYASPVAGGVATILFGLFPTATPAQVKRAMIDGARDVGAWNNKSVSEGILNAVGAVRALRRIRSGR
jgi:subtilase family protein